MTLTNTFYLVSSSKYAASWVNKCQKLTHVYTYTHTYESKIFFFFFFKWRNGIWLSALWASLFLLNCLFVPSTDEDGFRHPTADLTVSQQGQTGKPKLHHYSGSVQTWTEENGNHLGSDKAYCSGPQTSDVSSVVFVKLNDALLPQFPLRKASHLYFEGSLWLARRRC